MQRDNDLVRALLFAIEKAEFSSRLANPVVEGYDEATVDHHVYLLWQAGLVEALEDQVMRPGPYLRRAHALGLTWQGHDAIELLRNDTIWEKTKATVAKVGGATLPMMLEIAGGYVKEQLGLKP